MKRPWQVLFGVPIQKINIEFERGYRDLQTEVFKYLWVDFAVDDESIVVIPNQMDLEAI